MIKLNNWNGLDLSALEVGDKVGYLGHYTHDRHNAKEVEVVRVTATRVVIKSKLNDGREVEHAFMKSTGREVGSTQSWRACQLVTLESVEKAKAEHNAVVAFSAKIREVASIVDDAKRYDRLSPEHKAKLLELVSSL